MGLPRCLTPALPALASYMPRSGRSSLRIHAPLLLHRARATSKESLDLLSMALASEPLARHSSQCDGLAVAIVPHVWSGKLVGAMLITFIVQGVTIGAYAARLAGVQTKRIATSISLFNLFVTTGRLANLFMAFFVGPALGRGGKRDCGPTQSLRGSIVFELQLRLIVLAGTLGMIVFALLLADVHLSISARRPFVRGARVRAALAAAAFRAAR